MADLKENFATNSKERSFTGTVGKFKNFAGRYLLFGFAAAAATASLILFLWLAREVYTGQTINFDETVRRAARGLAAPWLTQTMIYVSVSGSQRFLLGGVIIFSIVFIWLKWKRAVIFLLATMAGEALLEVTLKLFFRRLRPEPFFEYAPLKTYSFPSGHALASLCFYGILAWLIARRVKSRGLKFSIWMAAATIVLLIGFSRIYLGVHFPSDVLAGFAAGFAWLFTVASTDYYFAKQHSKN
ncbi:MAG TPA: phosphatase PAP2 family protein [Pyrinomonadaceae bacterium]|jgi:undecaprenyl-diphosphatase